MRLAIIGGTGSRALLPPVPGAGQPVPAALPEGPWGPTSGPVLRARIGTADVLFLARHGDHGAPAIPPHRVNYRANLWALRELGAERVLGINAVGGIAASATPGRLMIPDQIIDYTWGREHTYTGDARFPLQHVEFTGPFDPGLRSALLAAARTTGLEVLARGTYAATQGPRLETAAEIDRLERDGCHVVGMTGMPEAGLARELGLPYAMCAVVVNRAAGRAAPGTGIHAEIAASLEQGMGQVRRLLASVVGRYPGNSPGQ